jgi:hypothetical protein
VPALPPGPGDLRGSALAALVALAVAFSGCLFGAPATPAPPATDAPATAEPPSMLNETAPPLRPCLGPWEGRGAQTSVTPLAALNESNTMPRLDVNVPDAWVEVWVNATPAREGQAWFRWADGGGEPLGMNATAARLNLTGDPAHGAGLVPQGALAFEFSPDSPLGYDRVEWEATVREAPNPDAAQCRREG